MPMIDAFLQELQMEEPATRRLLERVPENKLTWKPHEKAMSLGQLALHIASGPGKIAGMAMLDSFEMQGFQQPAAETRSQLLETLTESVAAARKALTGVDDARLAGNWKAVRDGKAIMEMPRTSVLRVIMLNHWYHHRGQLTTYLRTLGVPVPATYGTSADENPFA